MEFDWKTILIYLFVAVETGFVALILMGIKYLFNKGKMELPERQWMLMEKVIEQGVQYAEQKALSKEKSGGSKMKPEEKLELAKSLSEGLLDRLNLKAIKPLAVPLIEAKLRDIFSDDKKS